MLLLYMSLLQDRDFTRELVFRTSRSSGSGGQNVNKVSTRVELIFYVSSSLLLTDDEKALLVARLGKRIRNDGALHMFSQEERTQLRNKQKVTGRFLVLLETALIPEIKRKKTRVSREEKEKRIREKKKTALVKNLRKPPSGLD